MNKTDFLAHIRGFTNFTDPTVQTDDKISGWVFMAETVISETLRVADMVQIDTASVITNRVKMPDDFISPDLIRDLDADDGGVLQFTPRNKYYADGEPEGQFTQSGLYLIVGGTITAQAPKNLELHYFGDCPHLTTIETWLSGRFNGLLTTATLAVAFAAMEQDEQALEYQASATSQISSLNERYFLSVTGGWGTPMTKKVRGFG